MNNASGREALSARVRQEARGGLAPAIGGDGFDEELQHRASLLAKASGHGQHPFHEPGAFGAVRAEAAFAPQDGGANFLLAAVMPTAGLCRVSRVIVAGFLLGFGLPSLAESA